MSANEKHDATYHGPVGDDTVRGRYCDGTYMQTGHTTDGEEYDAWLAQVRTEAKAEALNEMAKELESQIAGFARETAQTRAGKDIIYRIRARAKQYKENQS